MRSLRLTVRFREHFYRFTVEHGDEEPTYLSSDPLEGDVLAILVGVMTRRECGFSGLVYKVS